MALLKIGDNPYKRLKREQFLTYIELPAVSPGTAVIQVIGDNLEEYNVELNPEVGTQKNILGQTITDVTSYEVSGTIEPYYARKDDPIYNFIKDIALERKTHDDCKVHVIEVFPEDEISGGGYLAYRQGGTIAVSSYGGGVEGAAIPFTLHYTGAREKGKFVPSAANRSGVFTVGTEED